MTQRGADRRRGGHWMSRHAVLGSAMADSWEACHLTRAEVKLDHVTIRNVENQQ